MKSCFSIRSGAEAKKLVSLSFLVAIVALIPQIGVSQNLVTDDTVEWYTLGSD